MGEIENKIKNLSPEKLKRVIFCIMASDEVMEAWSGCIPMTKQIFDDCIKLMNKIQAPDLFFDMYERYPEFLNDHCNLDLHDFGI